MYLIRFVLVLIASVCACSLPALADPLVLDVHSAPSERVLHDVLRLPQADSVPAQVRHELKAAIERFRTGDIDGCRERFNAAAAAHPVLPATQVMLARLFLATGQIPQGRLELEQAAAAQPQNPEAYILFGDLALAEGRVTDAHLHFAEAGRLIEHDDSAADPQIHKWRISVRVGRAAVAERRADWSAAEQALAEWLELAPDNAPARQRLGRVLFQLGRKEEAFKALQAAVHTDDTLEPAAVTMAWLNQQAGNTDKADEWIAEALKTQPNNPRVPRAAILRLLELGRAEEARPLVARLRELDADSPDVPRLEGLIARHLGDFETAERIFEQLYRDAPDDFAAVNQLALVLIEQEDERKRRRALHLAEINVRAHSRSQTALATLGWVNFRLGRHAEARQFLHAALNDGAVSAETAWYYARLLAEEGEIEQATKLLKDALGATGPFAYRVEAREWLGSLSNGPHADHQTTSD